MKRNFRRSVHAHDDDLPPPPAGAARGRSPDPTFRNRSRSRSRSRSRDRGREPRADEKAERSEGPRGREGSAAVKVDSVHHGRVTSCRDFGCFVRLPGCPRDGLLHISQVSDRRIDASELSQLLPVGHEVWVKVTDIKEDGKMGLTAKNVPGHERDALGGGGGGGGGVATTKSVHAKPPELFSIHQAVVSNATDFAVFVNLQPSGWDAMIHSTQLDEQHLLDCGARSLLQGYPKGTKCWVKVSAVDGYSTKAKLQASVKYVDQASGRDIDTQNEKLLLDLTRRSVLQAPSWQCHSSLPWPGSPGLALQSLGCAAHSGRAARPLGAHWKAAVRA